MHFNSIRFKITTVHKLLPNHQFLNTNHLLDRKGLQKKSALNKAPFGNYERIWGQNGAHGDDSGSNRASGGLY